MSFTIAVAGKGGTGKTTLAALLVEVIRRQDSGPILAVDADPNYTLGTLLGIKVNTTVSDIIEETKGLRDMPDGISKPAHLQYRLHQVLIENKGIDLLVMGHPEGPDCYCLANSILRGYIDEIARNYRYVVIDNEAGMEHLNRKTTQNIDALLMVSNPTKIGLKTAQRIKELIDKLTFLNIKTKYLVLNKVDEAHRTVVATDLGLSDVGIPLIGTLPFSPQIPELELQGQPVSVLPTDSELLTACVAILSKIRDGKLGVR